MPVNGERVVILGLGNELLADDGIGVHAAQLLLERGRLPEAEIIPAGTAVLDTLPALQAAERLIIVDAMRAGEAPGTIYQAGPKDCVARSGIISLHGFDIFSVMAIAGRADVPPTTIFGVEPEVIDWSLELSAAVQAALPVLVELVEQDAGPARNSGPDYCETI